MYGNQITNKNNTMEALSKSEQFIYELYLSSEWTNEEGFKTWNEEYSIVEQGLLSYFEIKIAKECLLSKGLLTEYINERDITSYYLTPINQ